LLLAAGGNNPEANTPCTAPNLCGVFRPNRYWDFDGKSPYDGNGEGNAAIDNDNIANTYRTAAFSTVAVIDRTRYFLTGGAAALGVWRFNHMTNSTGSYGGLNGWRAGDSVANHRQPNTINYPLTVAQRNNNITTAIVDIFILRPSPFFVVTRSRTAYEVMDYRTMTHVTTFDIPVGAQTAGAQNRVWEGERSYGLPAGHPLPNHGQNVPHRGGFGDYIDWRPRRLHACIGPDFTPMIHCWTIGTRVNRAAGTDGNRAAVRFGTFPIVNPSYPIRALAGIDETPYFGVVVRYKIKVYSIERNTVGTAAGDVDGAGNNYFLHENGPLQSRLQRAEHEESYSGVDVGGATGQGGFAAGVATGGRDNQIWDLVYVNTHGYAADGNAITGPRWTGGADAGATGTHDWVNHHRNYNIFTGPRDRALLGGHTKGRFDLARDDDLFGGVNTRENWIATASVDPEERFFFVTNDKGKTVWWHEGNAVDTRACHPFCGDTCHYAFSYRWCSGATCRDNRLGTGWNILNQDPNVLNTQLVAGGYGRRGWPPECYPGNFNDNRWLPHANERINSWPIAGWDGAASETSRLPRVARPWVNMLRLHLFQFLTQKSQGQ